MNRTMMQSLLTGLFFLAATSGLFAQAGGAAVPFLLISPDARASGMGETGTAIADNINAIHWNTGGLAFQQKRQIALTYSKWLPQFNADLFYSYGTYGQYFKELDGTIALNFIFMNLGQFQRTSDNGTALGAPFRSNEFAVGLSYGTLIGDDLGAGVQLRYIQSNLSPAVPGQQAPGVGVSGGFDFGLLWKPRDFDLGGGFDLSERFNLGLNLQNVGPKMTYRNEADPLPTMLRLGTAVNVVRDEFNDLTFTVDVAKLMVKRDEFGSDPLPRSFVTSWGRGGAELSMGAEYWYERVFALRGGYFTEPSRVGNRQFITFGAGVKYDIFHLDFSFINTIEENHPLANTMRFSLLIDWE
ncbi:MAG: PorV/PorQ family protein [Candidatus Kapabacteria bacterium]|nr:PorV/PorQ family protein [Candidatus Kapabacteria bacterium]